MSFRRLPSTLELLPSRVMRVVGPLGVEFPPDREDAARLVLTDHACLRVGRKPATDSWGANTSAVQPARGVRPCRWTGSCGGFDRGAGVAVLELDGAEIAQGGM
jgi:hypothetical protein